MFSIIGYWVVLISLLASWEMVLLQPERILYWFYICLVSCGLLSWMLIKERTTWKHILVDRLSFVIFCTGVFWWMLWLDFSLIKFAVPVIVWAALVYLLRGIQSTMHTSKLSLALFFSGVFFWGTISYGLLTVIGWPLWQTLVVFLLSFGLLAAGVVHNISDDSNKQIRAWLLLLLLGVEFFSVVAWLPFTEVTLSLILTICVLFVYDLEKYYINPEFIRKNIITKKVILYTLFLAIILISTPWH
jgi:hypothetical protein